MPKGRPHGGKAAVLRSNHQPKACQPCRAGRVAVLGQEPPRAADLCIARQERGRQRRQVRSEPKQKAAKGVAKAGGNLAWQGAVRMAMSGYN
ncbi:hypothetical protein L7F22_014424 [Adiantum nelumboides]|nr:hypothetical protein [Adiantum nelumboides]